jgi:hypothetical protein
MMAAARLAVSGSVLGVLAIVLASCQTMSKEECTVADWRIVGESDGAAGRGTDYILKHAKACQRVGVVPDQSAWLAGRETGLIRYCTPQNAVRVGSEGKSYANVCPPQLDGLFTQGYQLGKRVHDARARRDRVGSDISHKENERRELTASLGKDPAKDAAIRAQISQLDRDIGFLYGSQSSVNLELGRAEAEAEGFLASL